MRTIAAVFRIRFINGLQYRAAAVAGVVTQVVWGVLELLLFRAFYRSSPADFPMGFQQLASYIWLQQIFFVLFQTWLFDNDIFACIQDGNVAYELSRPFSLYLLWYLRNLAMRVARVALRFVPMLAAALLMPAPYGLGAPASPLYFLLFLVSMVLAALLVVAYGMLVYIAALRTLSPLGLRMLLSSVTEFLSGALIPLPFLPERVQRVLNLLPTAGMQNLPLRLYSAELGGAAAARGLALQVFWLAVLLGLGILWMRRSLRHVVLQGG